MHAACAYYDQYIYDMVSLGICTLKPISNLLYVILYLPNRRWIRPFYIVEGGEASWASTFSICMERN